MAQKVGQSYTLIYKSTKYKPIISVFYDFKPFFVQEIVWFLVLLPAKTRKDMRKIILAALCLLTLGACDNNSVKFTVEGTVEGAKDSMLYFEHMALSGMKLLDSVKLSEDGAFCFKADTTAAPEFYRLRIDNQIINISIDSTETVTVKAHYPNMAADYEVEGSDNCEKIRQLSLLQQELLRKAIAIDENRYLAPSVAQDSLTRLINVYKQMVTEQFIYQEPNKTYSYFALFQTLGRWLIFDPQTNYDDLRTFAAVATSWDTFYPGSERAQNLHNIVVEKQTERRKAIARMMNSNNTQITELGIIDLVYDDNHGMPQQLSSLKGKVVLLDFHTFTMKESTQRILMLRDLYNKYHDRGLEIYQISLDQDEHFWRQKTQNLPWISVRDADGESAIKYNVSSLPEFFTIDRNCQLQKRSSQMKDLEEEIKALL